VSARGFRKDSPFSVIATVYHSVRFESVSVVPRQIPPAPPFAKGGLGRGRNHKTDGRILRSVIPAEAGIQFFSEFRVSRDWTPASAGVTIK